MSSPDGMKSTPPGHRRFGVQLTGRDRVARRRPRPRRAAGGLERRQWRVPRSTASTVHPLPSSSLRCTSSVSRLCSTRSRWAGLTCSHRIRGLVSSGSATNDVQRERGRGQTRDRPAIRSPSRRRHAAARARFGLRRGPQAGNRSGWCGAARPAPGPRSTRRANRPAIRGSRGARPRAPAQSARSAGGRRLPIDSDREQSARRGSAAPVDHLKTSAPWSRRQGRLGVQGDGDRIAAGQQVAHLVR